MRFAVALGLFLVLLAPAAAAKPFLVRNDDQVVDGDFVVPRVGDRNWERDLFVVTGRMAVDGETSGAFLFLNSTRGVLREAERVEVYRVRSGQAYRDFVPQTFVNATVTFGNRSDMAWLPPPSEVDGSATFAAAVFADVLSGNEDLRRVRPGVAASGLIASVHEGTFSTTALRDGEESFLVPLSAGSRLEVRGEPVATPGFPGFEEPVEGNETARVFLGKDVVVRFVGPVVTTFEAPVVHLPFAAGAKAHFSPAEQGAFEAGFDLAAFRSLLADVQTLAAGRERNDTRLDAPEFRQLERNVQGLQPLLNGVFLGSPRGEIVVGGRDHDRSGLTVMRFTSLTFTNVPPTTTVRMEGDARLAYTNGELQTRSQMVHAGPLFFPVLGLLLWLVAIGLIVFERSKRPPVDEEKSARARLYAVVMWLGLLVVSFVLWDREVRYLLGTSLLSHGPGAGVGLGALAFVELLPWTVAYVAFGLPVVLAGRAGMKFAGLDKRAKGFAKGAGALATWFLGAPFILAIVAEFVRNLVGFLN